MSDNPRAQEPTVDERGDERHPAYAVMQVRRVSGHQVMFGSELVHDHYVSVTVDRASVKRDLNRDWVHPDNEPLLTFSMSLNQWAQAIASIGLGTGTQVTLTRVDEQAVPEIPHAPRIQKNVDEVRQVTAESLKKVAEAADLLETIIAGGKPRITELRAALARLRSAVHGAPERAAFAVTSLGEAAETIKENTQADMEARLALMLDQLPADMRGMLGTAGVDLRAIEAAPDSPDDPVPDDASPED